MKVWGGWEGQVLGGGYSSQWWQMEGDERSLHTFDFTG